MGSAQHPLNQILYGPPGTGKTWKTVAMAVAIAEEKTVEEVEREGRKEVKRRFEELRESGQVTMVTFHPNYAYGDFIESNRVLAKRARSWSIKEVLDGFLEWVSTLTESGPMPLNPPNEWPKILGVNGESVKILQYPYSSLRDAPKMEYLDLINRFFDSSPYTIKSIRQVKEKTKGKPAYIVQCLQLLRKYHDDSWKNHVLIIDEINRGDITRIFGELITLMEDSRRIGRQDETRVNLRYSGEDFGMPENLYLIGTMNTADRAIALRDTALRRRFEFVEMMPRTDHPEISEDAEGVNVRKLLRAMNERIRFLLDRNRQIGHTYFLGVGSIASLKRVFQNRIVPLLQEYFHDDWGKMNLVLNGNGFVKELVAPDELRVSRFVDADRKAYELLPFGNEKWNDPVSYRNIYAGS